LAQRLKERRDLLVDPPDKALYGTHKLPKKKLTSVLDKDELELYCLLVARLRRVPALCIVDPRPKACRSNSARPVRLLASGRDELRLLDAAIPVA
jgi:hypothetical protein